MSDRSAGDGGAGAKARVPNSESSAERKADFVALGVVSRPHGVRGEVRVHPFNTDSRLLGELKTVQTQGSDGCQDRVIVRARRAAKYWIVTFDGVASREAADALRGVELAVPRELLPPLDPTELYLADLAGLEVYFEDRCVGEVVGVLTYPSAICLEVEGPEGRRELPLLDPWVVDIDLEAGEVRCASWDDVPVVE